MKKKIKGIRWLPQNPALDLPLHVGKFVPCQGIPGNSHAQKQCSFVVCAGTAYFQKKDMVANCVNGQQKNSVKWRRNTASNSAGHAFYLAINLQKKGNSLYYIVSSFLCCLFDIDSNWKEILLQNRREIMHLDQMNLLTDTSDEDEFD